MSSPNPSEAEVVKVRGAVKRYDGVPVLDGLDVTVHDGETFGILGVNGAGKTTLMESIVGGAAARFG